MNGQANHCITVDARGCGKVDNRTERSCQHVFTGFGAIVLIPSLRRVERRRACGDRNPATPAGDYSIGDA